MIINTTIAVRFVINDEVPPSKRGIVSFLKVVLTHHSDPVMTGD